MGTIRVNVRMHCPGVWGGVAFGLTMCIMGIWLMEHERKIAELYNRVGWMDAEIRKLKGGERG